MSMRRAREAGRTRSAPSDAGANTHTAGTPATEDPKAAVTAAAQAKAERTAIERWETEGGRALPAERRS